MHAIWDRAWRRAGWAGLVMYQLALLYDFYALLYGPGGIWLKVTHGLLACESVLFGLAAICLPAAIILWTEADLPPEPKAESAP
jgi:hypothetical protein